MLWSENYCDIHTSDHYCTLQTSIMGRELLRTRQGMLKILYLGRTTSFKNIFMSVWDSLLSLYFFSSLSFLLSSVPDCTKFKVNEYWSCDELMSNCPLCPYAQWSSGKAATCDEWTYCSPQSTVACCNRGGTEGGSEGKKLFFLTADLCSA